MTTIKLPNKFTSNSFINQDANCQQYQAGSPLIEDKSLPASTDSSLAESLKRNVVLVGLGPHAKRIYLCNFKRKGFLPKLIVELESKKEQVCEYLRANDFPITTFFIPDAYRDRDDLPQVYQKRLLRLIQELSITHAIISTEPKAHFAYLKFFLANNIHTLCDKPITAPVHVSTQAKMARKIRGDYEVLKEIYSKAKQTGEVNCDIQCQRRWHEGYIYLRSLLQDCLLNYGIPITCIEIYHCDGMWNMPDEFLSRENHPYKYGYGKLIHSGYHFVDLLCWLEELNFGQEDKKCDNAELYTAVTRPNDFLQVLNNADYKQIFNTHKFAPIFQNLSRHSFEKFGEIDFYGLIQFKKGAQVISTGSLTLLQNGFSRRSWIELPQDTYKGNGRVRHERVNIQVGPLMNVQVHSYQSTEVKDRHKDSDYNVGSLEHFDIYIFRNVDIVGGKPFEKITLQSLTRKGHDPDFIGFNEQAREKCIQGFLSTRKQSVSDLMNQELTIQVLSNAYVSISNRKRGRSPIIKFSL